MIGQHVLDKEFPSDSDLTIKNFFDGYSEVVWGSHLVALSFCQGSCIVLR